LKLCRAMARVVLAPVACFAWSAGPANGQVLAPFDIYVRGEAGVAIHQNVYFNDFHTSAPDCYLCGGPATTSAGTSGIFGGAVGLRFNQIARADVSVDYLTPATLTGENSAMAPATLSTKFDSLVVLANGYLDFPEFPRGVLGPLIPYVDGGIGVARDALGTISGILGSAGAYSLSGRTQTSFAYALGVGLAYPVAPRLTADFGYRFFDLGGLATGTSLTRNGTTVQVTGAHSDGVGIQTVIAGLRYDL
jgi:opacity protein-like surface antigen